MDNKNYSRQKTETTKIIKQELQRDNILIIKKS